MNARKYENNLRRLLQKRLIAGESMASVARKAGMAPSWVVAWNAGTIGNPGIYTLEKLQRQLERAAP